MTLRDQVAEFHETFGQPVRFVPKAPLKEEVAVRVRLVAEEFCELMEALGMSRMAIARVRFWTNPSYLMHPVNMEAAVDAMADLDYVVEGTRLVFGVDGAPVAREVHAANMRKTGGAVLAGKIQKPIGWVGPDIRGCLIAQEWKP